MILRQELCKVSDVAVRASASADCGCDSRPRFFRHLTPGLERRRACQRSCLFFLPSRAAMTDQLIARAQSIVARLQTAGASQCLLVGGFVRDRLLGIASKDIDIEVYGLGYDRIVEALGPDHNVDLVGRSFGVVKVDNEVDVSIPRRESKSGLGHRGFTVHPDSTMTPQEAAARRDFTVNSMGMTPDGTIVDPFNGRRDIEDGILRATSPAFSEDPLRVLRGMQFAARFGFQMDADTIQACRAMVDEFQHLATERVWDEWYKWATKGRFPSKGLQVLKQTGWIVHFPSLDRMAQTPQDPDWHPEGDVLAHSGHSCDAAVDIADREGFDVHERAILVFAALCHDFGKVNSTVTNERDRLIAPKHAEIGAELARTFLANLRAPGWLTDSVVPLVGEHMVHMPHPWDEAPSLRTIRRLATRLAPATIRQWAAVCESDASGRPPKPRRNPVTHWVAVADRLTMQDTKPEPILLGRHLLDLGYAPGPEMGRILKVAFEAQLDGEFETVDDGLHWVQTCSATTLLQPE